MDVEGIVKMGRVVAAARTFLYAQKAMPGDDLGANARAVCLIEMEVALRDLAIYEGSPGFDSKASLDYLLAQADLRWKTGV